MPRAAGFVALSTTHTGRVGLAIKVDFKRATAADAIQGTVHYRSWSALPVETNS